MITCLGARFSLQPSPDWVSRFCSRYNISNRHVKHASTGEFDAEAYQAALRLFQYLVSLRLHPGELAFVDGKRLYERFQHSRQLAPKGR